MIHRVVTVKNRSSKSYVKIALLDMRNIKGRPIFPTGVPVIFYSIKI